MDIEVIVGPERLAVGGVDSTMVVEDIAAEVGKLAAELDTTPQRREKAAPKGAQGEFELIEWGVKFAADPKMGIVYARALIFAVNQILKAHQSNNKRDDHNARVSEPEKRKKPVEVAVLGKKIALPAATVVIRQFLKSLEENDG